ncbi:MAG: glycosyltransferase, partial [Leptospira sp.]|nr:glycosyltransferase [Leptospira sp.]
MHYGDIHVTDACIASVFASDFKNFELLVVDNHSNIPFSKSSFSKSKKIKSIVEKSNSGYAGGMNSGIKYYFGRTVTHFLFLNNDIVFEKNSLARMVECSIKNPSSIISPVMYKANPENLSEFGGALSPFKMFFHPLSSKPAENQKVSYVSGACLLINRNLISRIGLL